MAELTEHGPNGEAAEIPAEPAIPVITASDWLTIMRSPDTPGSDRWIAAAACALEQQIALVDELRGIRQGIGAICERLEDIAQAARAPRKRAPRKKAAAKKATDKS